MVTVIDVRCGNKLDKLTVCHKSKNTLCIGKEDVQDHLNHGDKLGDCTGSTSTLTQRSETAEGSIKEQVPATAASVYPNPTSGAFILQLTNTQTGMGDMLILDSKGRVVERRRVALMQGPQTIALNLKTNTPGMYLVQLSSSTGVQAFKIYLQR